MPFAIAAGGLQSALCTTLPAPSPPVPRVRSLVIILGLAYALAPAATAQSVITSVTAEELADVVRGAGSTFGVPISAEARTSGDTSSVVFAEISFPSDSAGVPDTLRFFVGLDGCEAQRCTALSAVAFFGTGEGGPGTDDMNAWNATRRLTRAYVTPEGLALQSDYDVAGGVTEAAVGRFIRSYLISLAAFADALHAAIEVPVEPAPAAGE